MMNSIGFVKISHPAGDPQRALGGTRSGAETDQRGLDGRGEGVGADGPSFRTHAGRRVRSVIRSLISMGIRLLENTIGLLAGLLLPLLLVKRAVDDKGGSRRR